MKKKKIMAVPIACFWGIIGTCLLGIIVGSFYDFGINEALANLLVQAGGLKTSL